MHTTIQFFFYEINTNQGIKTKCDSKNLYSLIKDLYFHSIPFQLSTHQKILNNMHQLLVNET